MNRMIKAKDYFGEYCMTYDDGKTLYRMMQESIKDNGKVLVSFEGVVGVFAVFLAHSFGELFKDYTRKEFDKVVEITNLTSDGEHVLENVLNHCERYHSDPLYRKMTDDIAYDMSRDEDTTRNLMAALEGKSVDENMAWIGLLLLTLLAGKGGSSMEYTNTYRKNNMRYDIKLNFDVVEIEEKDNEYEKL